MHKEFLQCSAQYNNARNNCPKETTGYRRAPNEKRSDETKEGEGSQ